MMNDREFLMWLHERLTEVHGEDPLYDYMHKLRAIILNTPKEQNTPTGYGGNSLAELKKKLEKKNET